VTVVPINTTGGLTVADAGERELVARVRARAGTPPSFVPIGIGDDAAVIDPPRGALDVVTTDVLVEGVHFRRDWTAPEAIGAKAVAVNFSDLAAMGAAPRVVLLSLVLPPSLPLGEFDALIDGVVTACADAGAALVGGNMARSPGPLIIDITAIGAAKRRRVLTRSGGRAGDALYVTGAVGAPRRAWPSFWPGPIARRSIPRAWRAWRATNGPWPASGAGEWWRRGAPRRPAWTCRTGLPTPSGSSPRPRGPAPSSTRKPCPVEPGAARRLGAGRGRRDCRPPSVAARITSSCSPSAPGGGKPSWPPSGRPGPSRSPWWAA
jgi:hypothetical protein